MTTEKKIKLGYRMSGKPASKMYKDRLLYKMEATQCWSSSVMTSDFNKSMEHKQNEVMKKIGCIEFFEADDIDKLIKKANELDAQIIAVTEYRYGSRFYSKRCYRSGGAKPEDAELFTECPAGYIFSTASKSDPDWAARTNVLFVDKKNYIYEDELDDYLSGAKSL